MNVTKRDLQIIIPFLLFVSLGIYGSVYNEFIERDKPLSTTLKWFGVPSLILAIGYAYRATFGYDKTVAFWRNTIGIIVFTVICSMMFFVSFQGFLILYNCNIGEQKTYTLKGQIAYVRTSTNNKGKSMHSIDLIRVGEKDTLTINVPHNHFYEGQSLTMEMKIGSLGYIYR